MFQCPNGETENGKGEIQGDPVNWQCQRFLPYAEMTNISWIWLTHALSIQLKVNDYNNSFGMLKYGTYAIFEHTCECEIYVPMMFIIMCSAKPHRVRYIYLLTFHCFLSESHVLSPSMYTALAWQSTFPQSRKQSSFACSLSLQRLTNTSISSTCWVIEGFFIWVDQYSLSTGLYDTLGKWQLSY